MKTFTSFGDFAVHLAEIAVAQHEAQHVALDRAAKLVEKTAKAKIGDYQDAAGPFAAWAALAPSTQADRERQGYPADDPGLRDGTMRDSIGRRVSDSKSNVGSDDPAMVYFEAGTIHQPPRSVLGAAAFEKADRVAEIVGERIAMALVGEDIHLGRLGIPDETD
ncbi:MAG: hypothetical protein M0006_05335 [Magnetospirillum sp.]|nr:hypothetical protein [Magnetospirillum sp.]